MSVSASAETRSLKLYYTHTKERATITFKRNGNYDQAGLKKLNRFLRDWRSKESIRMDPQLFDIVWEAYKAVGGRDYIHVVSSYRSPASNALLRRTRGGQAKKSQHMLGKALDFYIPGVSVKKLREVGFKLQGGGVGYYPKSGVPFVHLDTGNVRAWPRMSRRDLTRIFPKGGTLHLPPDGKPLPGYQQALANYKSRKARGQATINSGSSGGERRSGNLLAALFGGGADEEEDTIESAAPSRPSAPVQRAAPRQTPGTLLASLSPNVLPRPASAPRANRGGGVPVAITPQAPVAAPAPVAPAVPVAPPVQAVQPDVQVASLPDYQPPIPTNRPAVLIARVESTDQERRNAAEIEAALAVANATVQIAGGTDNAQQAGRAAQREAIVAALQARPAPQTASNTQLATLPVPTSAPVRPSADDLPTTVVAYAPPTQTNLQAAQSEPTFEAEAITKAARLPVPALRARQDIVETAALTDEPIFTTPKAPRPTSEDTSAPRTVRAQPAQTLAVGDHLTTTASLANSITAKERPDFMKNAQRAAPQVVYTQGFTRQVPPPATDRFTGNAVTFLAVAKFQGGVAGGDGQPLQLQVPAIN